MTSNSLYRTMPKKFLSLLLVIVIVCLSVPFALTSFAESIDINDTEIKSNVLDQRLSDDNNNLPSGANDFELMTDVDNSGNVSTETDTILKSLRINFVHKVYSVSDGSITDLLRTPDMKDLPSVISSGDKLDLINSKIYTGESEDNYNHAPTCSGYIFVGWYLDENLTIPAYQNDGIITVTEDQTFYAKWLPVGKITISKNDKYTLGIEAGARKSGFVLYGVQIRFKDYTNGGKSIRFVTRIRAALIDEIKKATGSSDVSYGYMMQTQEAFAEKCNYDPLRMSEFEANLNNGKYADYGDYFIYTGVIKNIFEDKFDTNFSAAAYIKYTDANGVKRRYCYEEPRVADSSGLEYHKVYHTNIRNVAKAFLQFPYVSYPQSQREYLEYIINYAE